LQLQLKRLLDEDCGLC